MNWRNQILKMAKGRFGANAWLNPEGLSVYVRVTQRYFEGEGLPSHIHGLSLCPTIDIATISADKPGEGALKKWLPQVEQLAEEMGRHIYIENVLTPRFAQFWRDRGYLEIMGTGIDNLSPCFHSRKLPGD